MTGAKNSGASGGSSSSSGGGGSASGVERGELAEVAGTDRGAVGLRGREKQRNVLRTRLLDGLAPTEADGAWDVSLCVWFCLFYWSEGVRETRERG